MLVCINSQPTNEGFKFNKIWFGFVHRVLNNISFKKNDKMDILTLSDNKHNLFYNISGLTS